jgi:hypothetical protein
MANLHNMQRLADLKRQTDVLMQQVRVHRGDEADR